MNKSKESIMSTESLCKSCADEKCPSRDFLDGIAICIDCKEYVPILPEWQERLIQERTDLAEKMEKLLNYLGVLNKDRLTKYQIMLEHQASAMAMYLKSLDMRLQFHKLY